MIFRDNQTDWSYYSTWTAAIPFTAQQSTLTIATSHRAALVAVKERASDFVALSWDSAQISGVPFVDRRPFAAVMAFVQRLCAIPTRAFACQA